MSHLWSIHHVPSSTVPPFPPVPPPPSGPPPKRPLWAKLGTKAASPSTLFSDPHADLLLMVFATSSCFPCILPQVFSDTHPHVAHARPI